MKTNGALCRRFATQEASLGPRYARAVGDAGASAASFGRAVRDEWPLDPGLAYLNHGTVGVAPIAVLDEQDRIRRQIESNPSRFVLREGTGMLGVSKQPSRLRRAAARVAEFVGAEPSDLVFVGNATEGVNAVLGSLGLQPGDGVLTTEKTYGGVRQAVRHACREAGAEVEVAALPCPVGSRTQVVDAILAATTGRTRLAVVDHIVSETGTVLPIEALVQRLRERGVAVLIDGAHAPGQVALSVASYSADYYTANLHKWACAPRSCGFLWARPEVQDGLHPPVVSWNLDEGLAREFDWTGTRDLSAPLAAPFGIEYLLDRDLEAVQRYNHELVLEGARLLSSRWQTRIGAPESMTAAMASVELPERFAATEAEALRLRDRLLFHYRIEVPVFLWGAGLWCRLSAQVYNEMEDFERLADAVDAEPGSVL